MDPNESVIERVNAHSWPDKLLTKIKPWLLYITCLFRGDSSHLL